MLTHQTEDTEFGVFVDIKRTIELNREPVKVSMGEPNGPCIILDLLAFYPAEETPSQSAVPKPSNPIGSTSSPVSFDPRAASGPYPMVLQHQLPFQSIPRTLAPPSTQVNPVQLHAPPNPTLPVPPSTTRFNGPNGGESADKKRKPSLDLRAGDQKRRKAENGMPTPPANGSSVLNPRDVFDLTSEEPAP